MGIIRICIPKFGLIFQKRFSFLFRKTQKMFPHFWWSPVGVVIYVGSLCCHNFGKRVFWNIKPNFGTHLFIISIFYFSYISRKQIAMDSFNKIKDTFKNKCSVIYVINHWYQQRVSSAVSLWSLKLVFFFPWSMKSFVK